MDVLDGNRSRDNDMQDDLISRQAAIDAMCSVCGHDCDKSKFVYNAPQDEQVIMCPEHYALSTLPSAQPDVPDTNVGKWINYWVNPNREDSLCFKCDQCDKLNSGKTNYCPNCGAKMLKEES